jgi:hypothetical protein
MSLFLDPTGRASYGIGLCARCSKKFFLNDLQSDPNSPGLMVCRDDLDDLDPYRLPARPGEAIYLEFVRPDDSLTDEGDLFTLSDVGIRGLDNGLDYRITDSGDFREVTL